VIQHLEEREMEYRLVWQSQLLFGLRAIQFERGTPE